TPAAPTAVARTAGSSDLLGTVGGLVGGVVNLLFKTLQLVGSIGGSLLNGRWKVVIPAGALSGDATVSLGGSSNTSSSCQSEISPADKNHFTTPATLTADCHDISSSQLANMGIFWMNPSTGQWVLVSGSKVDLTSKTISAPLQHFSIYSVRSTDGRAGW